MIIPMDASTSPTTPLGPMTRARARALKTEVTSLLSQLSFNSHETWLLPRTETLCILRYQGVSHGEANKQGESEAEDMREDGEEISQVPGWPDDPYEGLDDPDRARTIRTPIRTIRLIRPKTTEASPLKPDHPDPVPDHPDPAWTSGPPAGHPALRLHQPSLRIIRASTRTIRTSPDHPASDPDHPASAYVRVLG